MWCQAILILLVGLGWLAWVRLVVEAGWSPRARALRELGAASLVRAATLALFLVTPRLAAPSCGARPRRSPCRRPGTARARTPAWRPSHWRSPSRRPRGGRGLAARSRATGPPLAGRLAAAHRPDGGKREPWPQASGAHDPAHLPQVRRGARRAGCLRSPHGERAPRAWSLAGIRAHAAIGDPENAVRWPWPGRIGTPQAARTCGPTPAFNASWKRAPPAWPNPPAANCGGAVSARTPEASPCF